VQHLRLEYTKLGVARFASHRDFSRAFERALRRAEVPMAYSSGFSPHPRISYANAAPTSAESYAEYLDIAVLQILDPDAVARDLNEALPHGFRITRVIQARRPSLTELLQASEWTIDMGDVPAKVLAQTVDELLAADQVEVTRHTKKGDRTFDVRPAIASAHVNDPQSDESQADSSQIWVRLRHGSPLVRPDDVVRALRVLHPGLGGDHPGLFARLKQGPLEDAGEIGDPLDSQWITDDQPAV
jgi:radical SAM-linked protein